MIAETHVLLKSRLALRVSREHARNLALHAIEEIHGSSITIEPVISADEQSALTLLARYIDHDFSFTDATSFIVMRRLRIDLAFTF
ncbi:MAG: PIN domain-containing protein, partial [Dehalococcoidia bacterium]